MELIGLDISERIFKETSSLFQCFKNASEELSTTFLPKTVKMPRICTAVIEANSVFMDENKI